MAMPPQREQFWHLANLKGALTALVILHHTAIAYGGAGQLSYHSPSNPPNSELALVAFNAVNQTFFMALFFFVAGFFSRRSLERRGVEGVGRFARERFRRLGVPTIGYSLLAPPLCVVISGIGRAENFGWAPVWKELVDVRGVRGPVWFCALLLIFDGLLAALWKSKDALPPLHTSEDENSTMGGTALLSALSLLTVIEFAWRRFFPVGFIFTPLNLTLGYLPQYVAAYTFGVMVPRPEYGISSFSTTALLTATSAVTGITLGSTMSSRVDTEQDPTWGGFNPPAAIYAIWNNATGYLLGGALLRLFYRRLNFPLTGLTDLAFSAFLIHIPVSTLMEVMLEGSNGGPATKTIVIGIANCIASWAAAWLWHTTCELSVWHAISRPPRPMAPPTSRRRGLSTGQQAIEILEGLDEVGC